MIIIEILRQNSQEQELPFIVDLSYFPSDYLIYLEILH